VSDDVTPHPPATREFGAVEPGGPAHVYATTDGLRVRKFSVGEYDNNVYVVSDGDDALIVDGADAPERILEEVAGRRVVGIVQTHNHFDHVRALASLVEALGAPVYAHASDPMPVETRPLDDDAALTVGGTTIQALHTPGHTPGSTCYVAGTLLFSGDTLFPGGPGKTSDRASFERIMHSLDRLFSLPDDTRVCPGHGLDTTIGRERPYVEVWRRRGW